MDTLRQLLEKIEKCPALYIGCKDIHRLRAFLSGYDHACEQTVPGYEYGWLWEDFRLWLAERYADRRAFDWATLIAAHEPDGQSTDAFFRLLNEYLAANKKSREEDKVRSGWESIQSDEDIEVLIALYGFIDAFVSEIHFESGDRVEEHAGMRGVVLGGLAGRKLLVTFTRADKPTVLRICFGGVRDFRLREWDDRCGTELEGGRLFFRTDLLGRGRDDRLICWSDSPRWDPAAKEEGRCSYVIASEAFWRITHD